MKQQFGVFRNTPALIIVGGGREEKKGTIIMKNTILVTGILFFFSSGAINAHWPQATDPKISGYTTHWIGNTWGGVWDGTPAVFSFPNRGTMQMNVLGIAVASDGTIYTASKGSEDQKSLGIYKEGADYGQLNGAHQQWQMNSDGGGIAANDTWVFATFDKRHHNFPDGTNMGKGWVRRFSRATLKPDPDIKVSTDDVRGLAITASELFASDRVNDSIKVYDIQTLAFKRGFRCRAPGRLTVQRDSILWVLCNPLERSQYAYSHDTLRSFTTAGTDRNITVALPAAMKAASIYCKPGTDTLLIADDGPDQNIKFYDARQIVNGPLPPPIRTFGDAGGIYSGIRGATGPHKLFNLSDVAYDSAGNLYVSQYNPLDGDLPFSALRCYSPDGALRWETHGLWMANGVLDYDELNVYSGMARYSVDFNARVDGNEYRGWSLAAITVDRETFPDDARLQRFSFRFPVAVRNVGGKRILYVSIDDRAIAMFRFDSARHGETAIPCGYIANGNVRLNTWPPNRPAGNEWIWTDADGDGSFDVGEYESSPVAGLGADQHWCVDSRADLWTVSKTGGIRKFVLQGLNSIGAPKYSYEHMQSYPMPAPFTLLRRIVYDAATDCMFLSGYTDAFPNDSNIWWKGAGRVLAKYDRWSEGNRTAAWIVDNLLYYKGPYHQDQNIINIDVAGEYVFVQHGGRDANNLFGGGALNSQRLEVYRTADGSFEGYMVPTPDASIGYAQIDMVYGMRAAQRKNGEYLVFIEDDWHGKFIMYRWCPDGNCEPSTKMKSGIKTILMPTNAVQLKRRMLTVHFESKGPYRVEVVRIDGRVCLQWRGGSKLRETFDVGSLVPGMYIVRVNTAREAVTRNLIIGR